MKRSTMLEPHGLLITDSDCQLACTLSQPSIFSACSSSTVSRRRFGVGGGVAARWQGPWHSVGLECFHDHIPLLSFVECHFAMMCAAT